MKKFTVIFMSALLVLSGCASKEPKDDKTITFWHAMGGNQLEVLEDITKDFTKETGIKVKLQNQGQYKDLQAKITTAETSPETLPNVVQAYPNWMIGQIKSGLVVDLTDKVDFTQYVQGFTSQLKFDDKYFGVPFVKSTEVLVYNKDIVDELGLKLPTTLEEYYDFCKTIQEETGIPGGGFDHLGNFYETWLYNNGVILDNDTNIMNKTSVEAANYIYDGHKEGYFKPTQDYLSSAFGKQQVMSYVGTNGGLGYMEKSVNGQFNVGVALYPDPKSIAQGTDLFVYNKNEKQNNNTIKYIEYLTSKESQIKIGMKTGYIPSNQAALDSEEYSEYKYADTLKNVNTYSLPASIKQNKLYLASLKYFQAISNGSDPKEQMELLKREQEKIYK